MIFYYKPGIDSLFLKKSEGRRNDLVKKEPNYLNTN